MTLLFRRGEDGVDLLLRDIADVEGTKSLNGSAAAKLASFSYRPRKARGAPWSRAASSVSTSAGESSLGYWPWEKNGSGPSRGQRSRAVSRTRDCLKNAAGGGGERLALVEYEPARCGERE